MKSLSQKELLEKGMLSTLSDLYQYNKFKVTSYINALKRFNDLTHDNKYTIHMMYDKE